jgi:hypothetical protein
MQPLISSAALQGILEKGLLQGYWSIDQFNKTSKKGEPVLPTPGFITEHPQFFDKTHRDLDAYAQGAGRRDWF